MAQGSIVLLVETRLEDDKWRTALPDIETVAVCALEASAQRLEMSGAVDLLLTDDTEMQTLNAQWRNKDKPTDVLSFPADPEQSPPGGQRFFGDLALGFGVTKADADKLDRSLDLHVTHLLVHGFLHLVGHDHISPADAKLMEGLEAEILAPLGLPDPYGDSA